MKTIELTQDLVTVVDDDDFKAVSAFKWCAHRSGSRVYAARSHPYQKMHTLIMQTPEGMDVDHINGDTLDNRRCNLRIVERRTNSINTRRNRAGKLPGVSWHSSHKAWRAVIRVDEKHKHLGYFQDKYEAYNAYVNAYLEVTNV